MTACLIERVKEGRDLLLDFCSQRMQKLTIFTENLQFSNAEMCEQEANFRVSRKVKRRAYQVL